MYWIRAIAADPRTSRPQRDPDQDGLTPYVVSQAAPARAMSDRPVLIPCIGCRSPPAPTKVVSQATDKAAMEPSRKSGQRREEAQA